jgi:hypothetical protein
VRGVTHQPDISDEAVLQATGRSWREWLSLLAGEEMASKTHEAIIVFLREEHGVPAWWQQVIASCFEESIGRRSEHEMDDGFQAHVTRTLAMPQAVAFAAWTDENERAKWLRRGDFEPTTVREPGTVRGKWVPDGSRVDVELVAVDESRCELAITHRKLASEALGARMQQLWQQSLDRLVERIGSAK